MDNERKHGINPILEFFGIDWKQHGTRIDPRKEKEEKVKEGKIAFRHYIHEMMAKFNIDYTQDTHWTKI